MIHEVDEPPLGVPGELHFDDEEEEVERGGWAFIHFIIVLTIRSWRMHKVLFKATQYFPFLQVLDFSQCQVHPAPTVASMILPPW